MYNNDIPNRAELPTARRLLRSTLLAMVAAIAILVTVILPAEYGLDPTGVGRLLGLTAMGEIKQQLAEEAEADRQRHAGPDEKRPDQSMIQPVIGFFFTSAYAHEGHDEAFIAPITELETGSTGAQDRFVVTLAPGESFEAKLVMQEGGVATYSWKAEGGLINYDLHGHGAEGQSKSYDKGRGVSDRSGTLTAAFDGEQGWFWRNRDKQELTLTFEVQGDYSEFRKAESDD